MEKLKVRHEMRTLSGAEFSLAIRAAAEALYANAAKPAIPPPAPNTDADEFYITKVCEFCPATGPSNPLPAEVRAVLRLSLESFRKNVPPSPDATTLFVENKGEAEKLITLSGIKVPRNSEIPYRMLYPQHWFPVDPLNTVTEWHRQLAQFVSLSTIGEIHRPRFLLLLKQMEAWFDLRTMQTATAAEELPKCMISLFFATVQQLLELSLLSTNVRLQTSQAGATSAFNSTMEQQFHAAKLDFFAALKEAKTRTSFSH